VRPGWGPLGAVSAQTSSTTSPLLPYAFPPPGRPAHNHLPNDHATEIYISTRGPENLKHSLGAHNNVAAFATIGTREVLFINLDKYLVSAPMQ
jgi:predicted alpha/beta-hydrolase family hydrolase